MLTDGFICFNIFDTRIVCTHIILKTINNIEKKERKILVTFY